MTSIQYVNKINRAELAALLRVKDRDLDRLTRRLGLPAPIGTDAEGTWWSHDQIRAWLAETGYLPARGLLVEWWPDATEPAAYLGAEVVRRDALAAGPSAVLHRWRTGPGVIVVVWETARGRVRDGEMAEWAPDADAFVVAGWDWGAYGPSLWARTGDERQLEATEIEWSRLARVLGRPVPFWPSRLRHPDLIHGWTPGDPVVRHVGVLGLDITPLTRMALLYPDDHVAHRALIHSARVIANRGDAGDCTDLPILAERLADESLSGEHIMLAAEAAPNPARDEPVLDETIRRAGWREVLHREDRLAQECVEVMLASGGGKDWAHAHTITIPANPYGAEFLARLEPAPPRALYHGLDPHRRTTAMIDPRTDIPVAVPVEEYKEFEEIRAFATHRLPTTNPLAELILDGPIWVRTDNGVLYPAPQDAYYGLNWGYSGSGPRVLAALITALLTDITARGARLDDPADDGLITLFRRKMPNGTVLTRAELQAALTT
ncbi:hypothetical protein [Actinokineospora cianjurensis]|uniref:Uncharacterized protein n=1 Tax=Actinokineospora cianjurensis TaxID=585224 RepID=A0A421B1V8_9PSEU|nr:hypothetical protein [Actinokineospora cianjurensis]RLK58350.1 hypothetical protein CLV68_4448 [Actinokineospora cianjurensis]